MNILKRNLRKFPVRLLIISLALAVLIAFTTLTRPAAQGETPTPVPLTPTITPTPYRPPGDTTGLMVMSAVLVIIVIAGVIMGQNLVRARVKGKPPETQE